jgi:hypothetical protein
MSPSEYDQLTLYERDAIVRAKEEANKAQQRANRK